MLKQTTQRGSVIIITLWTIILLTILVTVLAGQIRLSARAATYHQDELRNWSQVLAAVNQAEMELMLERMDPILQNLDDLVADSRSPAIRFNGRELQLNYPQAEGITVRIYDHAGKINLNEISPPRLRDLLTKQLKKQTGKEANLADLDNLLAAWGDWLDLNEQAGINGAESDYYEGLDLPYTPRNGRLETVEEILNIRGFAQVFAGVDLDAAFTLYGENELVNLNLATVEAMQLLPGLDDELIAQIIAYRQDNEFQGNGDVAQIIPADNMAELRPWLNSRKFTNYYSIMAYRKPEVAGQTQDDSDQQVVDTATTAFAEVVQIDSYTNRPKVIKSNPYQAIPVRYVVDTGTGNKQ